LSEPLLNPRAEPFFFPGNRIGVLLTHGFTGAPFEMREMGQHLADQGFTVLGIRLAGHATQPEDLARVKWNDWLANVEDGVNLLLGSTDQIFLAGLSLGAILSLVASARWQEIYPIQGVISMSCVVRLPEDWRVSFIRPFSLIQPTMPQGPADFHNSEAALDHICYPYYPTRALVEVRDLMAVMRASLPQIQTPVFLAQSLQDHSAGPESLPFLEQNLSSAPKTVLQLKNSGHVITREPEREQLFSAVVQFIQTYRKA